MPPALAPAPARSTRGSLAPGTVSWHPLHDAHSGTRPDLLPPGPHAGWHVPRAQPWHCPHSPGLSPTASARGALDFTARPWHGAVPTPGWQQAAAMPGSGDNAQAPSSGTRQHSACGSSTINTHGGMWMCCSHGAQPGLDSPGSAACPVHLGMASSTGTEVPATLPPCPGTSGCPGLPWWEGSPLPERCWEKAFPQLCLHSRCPAPTAEPGIAEGEAARGKREQGGEVAQPPELRACGGKAAAGKRGSPQPRVGTGTQSHSSQGQPPLPTRSHQSDTGTHHLLPHLSPLDGTCRLGVPKHHGALGLIPQGWASAPALNPCKRPQNWVGSPGPWGSPCSHRSQGRPRALQEPGDAGQRRARGKCVKIYFHVENRPPKRVWLCQTWSGARSRVRAPDTGGDRETPGTWPWQGPAARAMAAGARLALPAQHWGPGTRGMGTPPWDCPVKRCWLLPGGFSPPSPAPGHNKKFKIDKTHRKAAPAFRLGTAPPAACK